MCLINERDCFLLFFFFLSKVTLHTDCCSVLADQAGCYTAFVHLLQRHLKKDVSIGLIHLY